MTDNGTLFWSIADAVSATDARVVEGTIMKSRCLRVADEFLALVDDKRGGLVVKLPRDRVAQLCAFPSPIEPSGKGSYGKGSHSSARWGPEKCRKSRRP
jgi:hypothetical protein